MSHSPIQTLGSILTPIVTIVVVWRGGRPERIVALASLAAYLISPAAQALSHGRWPLLGVAGVDISLCALLIVMSLLYDRTWLVMTAGVELATVLAHLGMILDPTLMARGYVTSLWIFYFIFLAALTYSVVETRYARLSARPG
jgi:cytochrome c biogenesis factor